MVMWSIKVNIHENCKGTGVDSQDAFSVKKASFVYTRLIFSEISLNRRFSENGIPKRLQMYVLMDIWYFGGILNVRGLRQEPTNRCSGFCMHPQAGCRAWPSKLKEI